MIFIIRFEIIFNIFVSVPRSIEPSVLKKIRIDDSQYDSPAYTATIRIPVNITKNESGKIIFMAILIAQKVFRRIHTNISFVLLNVIFVEMECRIVKRIHQNLMPLILM